MKQRLSKLTADDVKSLATASGYTEDSVVKFRKKWIDLRHHAKVRGIPCSLLFAEYLDLARSANLTSCDDIGRLSTQFQLGRVGDTGPYSMENCRFITHLQNRQEAVLNGGQTVGNIKHSGSKHGHAKLSEDQVVAIRKAYAKGGVTQAELCKVYGIAAATMSQIISKTLWRHV